MIGRFLKMIDVMLKPLQGGDSKRKGMRGSWSSKRRTRPMPGTMRPLDSLYSRAGMSIGRGEKPGRLERGLGRTIPRIQRVGRRSRAR